jgi:hypothetical protein
MSSKLPFILRFGVEATNEIPDYSLIQYSSQLQLNIVKSSGEPAIGYLPLDTETFTKTMGEASDSDRDSPLLMLLDTTTDTRRYLETTDSDADAFVYQLIKDLVDINTLAEVRVESTNTDQGR